MAEVNAATDEGITFSPGLVEENAQSLGDVIRQSASGVIRGENPNAKQSEVASVKKWMGKIKAAEKHHEKAFKRMRDDMDFAYKYGIGKQWDGQLSDDERYIANFIQRHITTRVSSLYAKNPKAIYQRRQRLDFRIWDGDAQSLEQALAEVQQAALLGMQASPFALELLADVQQGAAQRKMLDRLGKTLEILFNYSMKEQCPTFKAQMKQLVRRVITCGVAYVRPGYQRLMEKTAENQARLSDAMTQLKHLERLRDDMFDNEFDGDSPEMEELRATIDGLQSEDIILREGLTFDFPRSTSLIVDPKCTQLVGWLGADWLAEKWFLPPEEIQEIWRVDIGNGYVKYDYYGSDSVPRLRIDANADSHDAKGLACVYKVYNKKTGRCFVICDGYQAYLQPPYAPDVRSEAFFPHKALAFNQIEHEEEIFPPSDVTLLKHQQKEHNRTREAVRQHRIANRPLYVSPTGALEEEDQAHLSSYPAHAVIEVNGLKEGQNANALLQPVDKVPIDPNVYQTQEIFTDALRVVGEQEANFGGPRGKQSATESTIAETSRVSSLASNVDDLDDLLTDLARDCGKILMLYMNPEMVTEIVGPGAIWPQFSTEQIMKEVWLEVQAGSSGRPNKAQELANFERVAPFVVQVPGVSPTWLGKYLLKILDDRLDIEEAIVDGMPSIQAINQMMGAPQLGTGIPATDPNQQGAQGFSNAPRGQATEGGPQAQFNISQQSPVGPGQL